MEKRTIFFSLLLLAPATLTAQVLIDGPEVDLTEEELRMVISTVPDQYKAAMLQNKDKLRQIMDTTYMTKVAAYILVRVMFSAKCSVSITTRPPLSTKASGNSGRATVSTTRTRLPCDHGSPASSV